MGLPEGDTVTTGRRGRPLLRDDEGPLAQLGGRTTFLRPAMRRRNLKVITGAEVLRHRRMRGPPRHGP